MEGTILMEGDRVEMSIPEATGIVKLVKRNIVTVQLDKGIRPINYTPQSYSLTKELVYDLSKPIWQKCGPKKID